MVLGKQYCFCIRIMLFKIGEIFALYLTSASNVITFRRKASYSNFSTQIIMYKLTYKKSELRNRDSCSNEQIYHCDSILTS